MSKVKEGKKKKKEPVFLPNELWNEILLYCDTETCVIKFQSLSKEMQQIYKSIEEVLFEKKVKLFLKAIAKEGIKSEFYDEKFEYFQSYKKQMYSECDDEKWLDAFKKIYFWSLPSKLFTEVGFFNEFMEEHGYDDEEECFDQIDVPERFNYGDMLQTQDYRLCCLYFVGPGRLFVRIEDETSAGYGQNDFEVAKFYVNNDLKYKKFWKDLKEYLYGWWYRGDDCNIINLLGKPLNGQWMVYENLWFEENGDDAVRYTVMTSGAKKFEFKSDEFTYEEIEKRCGPIEGNSSITFPKISKKKKRRRAKKKTEDDESYVPPEEDDDDDY